MRNLLLFVFCAGLFASTVAHFQLFGKKGELKWKDRLKYQDRGFCQDLGNITKKNLFKYLLCNITAVKEECEERATQAFYLTSRDNVSRAVRGAAELFPRVKQFILSMENASYAAIDCYWNAFFEVEQEVANGDYSWDQWDEHWQAKCDGYKEEVQVYFDMLNKTGGPYVEVFLYTYPGLSFYPNNTFAAIIRNLGQLMWANTSESQFYAKIFTNLGYFTNWNSTDIEESATRILWTADWIRPTGYLHDNFTTMRTLGQKFSNAQLTNLINPAGANNLTTAEYEQLAKIIYIFQEYFKEKSIIFFNDFVGQLIAENVTDDKSDPIVTSVSYLWGDFIGNLTGNNNTVVNSTTSTNSTYPSDAWLDRVCNYLTNGTTTFPTFPGCAGKNFWNVFENVTQRIRYDVSGTNSWVNKVINKVTKVKNNVKNTLNKIKNNTKNNDNSWNFNWG